MLITLLSMFFLLVSLLDAYPAQAAWPPDWPFLQAEEGWFFYKDPPLLQTPEIPPDRPPEPESPDVTAHSEDATREPPGERLEKPSELPKEREAESASGTLTFRVEASPELQVAPVAGPQLEGWLIAVSDRDLERLVAAAPAAALRAWIPILLDQALTVLDRTAVRKYLLAQRESLRRSERFSKLWEEVIWTDPTFDRPGHIPTGSLAQTIYEQDRTSQQTATLAALRGNVSLLVVLEPDCAACEAQWKILTSWSARSGITARPIARDLLTLADSTLALPYPRVIDSLGVAQWPSLYLVEPATGYLTRLGGGLLSEEEISTRILRLVAPEDPQQKGDLRHVRIPPPSAPIRTRINTGE